MMERESKIGERRVGTLVGSPAAVVALGLFPSIAITTRVDYALTVGVGVLFVLVGSRLVASLIAAVIPEKVRFFVHLIVISTLVTALDQAMRAYAPVLSRALGIYVPLIAVNCLILEGISQDRSKVGKAALNALGIGAGFALSLTLVALVREVLGSGTITLFPLEGWSGIVKVAGLSDRPIRALAFPAGAFLTVAYLAAFANWVAVRKGWAPRAPGRNGPMGPDSRDRGAPESTA